jgi:hypothetical protein
VTDKIRRTAKFLCAMGRGIPIVSQRWLASSKDAKTFQGSILEPRVTGDRCCYFKNIFAKKIGEKMAFLAQNKARFCKNVTLTKNANIFA